MPSTPAALHLARGEHATVQYVVTNETRFKQNLVMHPLHGVTQIVTGVGACAEHFALASKQSCVLTLAVSADELTSGGVHGGPVVCRADSHHLCAQPTVAHQLSVVVNPPSE